MNYSRQRQLIFEAVHQTKTHPTTDSVYQKLKRELPKLSLATVYRNLNQLCDNGQLRRLCLPDSPDRFDGNIEPHCHLHCRVCSAVVDLFELNEEIVRIFSENTEHRIESGDFVLHGVCSSCIKKMQKKAIDI